MKQDWTEALCSALSAEADGVSTAEFRHRAAALLAQYADVMEETGDFPEWLREQTRHGAYVCLPGRGGLQVPLPGGPLDQGERTWPGLELVWGQGRRRWRRCRIEKELLWADDQLAVLSTGYFYLRPTLASGHCWYDQPPGNFERIWRCEEARRLGLDVPLPPEEWSLDPELPVGGTEAEIKAVLERANATLRFNLHARTGREIVGTTSPHGEDCRCGNCPLENRYGNGPRYAPSWEPAPGIIPDTWYTQAPHDLTTVSVQTADGRRSCRWVNVRQSGSWGMLLGLDEAARHGLPADVLAHLEALHVQEKARLAQEVEDRRRQLLLALGLPMPQAEEPAEAEVTFLHDPHQSTPSSD